MGLALEESTDGLEKLESNSIEAFLDKNLLEFLHQNGKVTIDYRSHPSGGGGYSIVVGENSCNPGNCDSGGCHR